MQSRSEWIIIIVARGAPKGIRGMKEQNICKFVSPHEHLRLVTHNFIFESVVAHSGEMRSLPHNILYLVSSGEGLYKCGGQCCRIHTGDVFFSFSEIPFAIENTSGLKYYYISFHGDRSEMLFRRFGIAVKNCVFEVGEGLIPLWRDSLARSNEENIDLLSESLLLYTFSKLKKADRERADAVSFVLTYLEGHFTDPKLSLAEVADAAGYNGKYLSHVFKQQFGMRFSEYLRLIRIKHAVMLIENGLTSVKNVAALSGFSDPLYFSKVFTESIGVSPSEYRKKE